MTNSPGGNAIEAYARAGDGLLTPAGTGDGTVVVNVNVGSNSVSAFAATLRGLRLIGTASSGGTDPNSVTIAGDDLVYVLNAGSDTIAGLRLGDGRLRPIPGSVRPPGAGALLLRQIRLTAPGRRVDLPVSPGAPGFSPSMTSPIRDQSRSSLTQARTQP
jgi:hypothetical protein